MLQQLKYFDWLLFAAVILLAAVGVMMIYSTGLSSEEDSGLWLRQILALAIGLAAFFFFSSLDYRFLKKSSTLIYIAGVVLLVGLFAFGDTIRNSTRWYDIGIFNFQPAEFMKLAVIIFLARYLQQKQPLLARFSYIAVSFGFVLIPAILIIFQPDLGSAILLFAIWGGTILISGIPRRYLLYLFVGFLLVSVLSWQFILADYQKERLGTFLNPTADPLGQGYNVLQSIVAVGSGGFFGRGLARGLQSQLRFLPERQTDFIFASTVEELGFVGGTLVLGLLVFLLLRMIRIIKNTRDLFGAYLAAGIFFLFLTQIMVNIGMNLGIFPVTGITLPFISYGGSSLVIMLALAGIMESIARYSVPVRFS